MQTNRPSTPLANVTRATRKRARTCDNAYAEYLNAIRAARDAGHTLREIGEAAGLTREGVRYLLKPDPRKEQT